MNSILHNEKGVALVVTLAIVAILIAAALQLGKFTGDSVMVTLVDKDQFQAEQWALSGMNLAVLILTEDAEKTFVDSVQEVWADPDMLSQAVNEMGLEKGTLTIKITDELSKIQVNALIKKFPGNLISPDQSRVWENFFRLRLSSDKAVDQSDPLKVINSVKDWLDSVDDDAISGFSGAESDYYLGLDPPYVSANGPFNHIDELLNVKGISKDLLNNENMGGINELPEKIKLSDVFSVYGLVQKKFDEGDYRYPGKVNINTADVDVIAALLPEGMEDLALELVDFRAQKSEEGDVFVNPLDKGWYKKVIELSKKEEQRFDRVIRYSSDIFKVECTARKNDSRVKLIAFLKRAKHKVSGKWMCRTIQMERN